MTHHKVTFIHPDHQIPQKQLTIRRKPQLEVMLFITDTLNKLPIGTETKIQTTQKILGIPVKKTTTTIRKLTSGLITIPS